MGQIKVGSLKGGTWCVTETGAAPRPGGPLDPDTECFTVGPTTAEAAGAAAGSPTFTDPLKKVILRVDKTESSPGIDGTTARSTA